MNIKESGDITIIELSGYVDAESSPEIRRKVRNLISEGRIRLVIDLGKVKYMDSLGLGILISGLKNVRKEKGDLKLVALHAGVQETFGLTELIDIFDVFEKQEDAVKAFH